MSRKLNDALQLHKEKIQKTDATVESEVKIRKVKQQCPQKKEKNCSEEEEKNGLDGKRRNNDEQANKEEIEEQSGEKQET